MQQKVLWIYSFFLGKNMDEWVLEGIIVSSRDSFVILELLRW